LSKSVKDFLFCARAANVANCRDFLVEEELRDKSRKLEQLQSKFADLEEEYVVLYQQQQNQQG
jgi:hypothetical protein